MSEQDEARDETVAVERKRRSRYGLALKSLKQQTAEREQDWVEVIIPWYLTETARTEYARLNFPNGQTREGYVDWLNERVRNHIQQMLLGWFDRHVEVGLYSVEGNRYLADQAAGLTQD